MLRLGSYAGTRPRMALSANSTTNRLSQVSEFGREDMGMRMRSCAGQIVFEERARFGQPVCIEIVDNAARRVAEYLAVQFVLGFQHALKRQRIDLAAL